MALAAVLVTAACGEARPQTLVICHNGNCAGPADTANDDAPEALSASLRLREADGRPTLDGVEIDTFWHRAQGRCLFAHDTLGRVDVPASFAAEEIAEWLRTTPDAARDGGPWYTFIELKPFVGPNADDKHTDAELALHTDCALDLLATIAAGATAGGHDLVVVFDSASPRLLRALVARPRWAQVASGPVEVRLSADFGAPAPYADAAALDQFGDTGIDTVEVHVDFFTDGARQAVKSMGLDVMLWMFSANTEDFDAIHRYHPKWVLTSEAPLLRGWLSYQGAPPLARRSLASLPE